jgi:hypothetical protein
MIQSSFDAFRITLNDFEQATLQSQVSYKASTDNDVKRLLSCDKLKLEVKLMVEKWNKARIKLGLVPW